MAMTAGRADIAAPGGLEKRDTAYLLVNLPSLAEPGGILMIRGGEELRLLNPVEDGPNKGEDICEGEPGDLSSEVMLRAGSHLPPTRTKGKSKPPFWGTLSADQANLAANLEFPVAFVSNQGIYSELPSLVQDFVKKGPLLGI